MSVQNWPMWVKILHDDEMTHIRRLWNELLDGDIEAHSHPFIQSCLDWAATRASRWGKPGYRIKSIAQYTMELPPDAYDVPQPTDRRLRSMTRGNKLAYRSLSMTSYKSSSSAATPIASATNTGPSSRRVKDTRRTPDYVTLLTRNDPSQAHERIMCVHELKRYRLGDDHTGARPRLRNPSVEEIKVDFTRMEKQTGEQAQVALYKFKHAKVIYVMCHIGMYFRVLRYVSKVSKPKSKEGQFGRVRLRYRGKITDILNKDQTDFSAGFKRWWTQLKDYALQADAHEEASADEESQSDKKSEDVIYESEEDGGEGVDVEDGSEDEAEEGDQEDNRPTESLPQRDFDTQLGPDT